MLFPRFMIADSFYYTKRLLYSYNKEKHHERRFSSRILLSKIPGLPELRNFSKDQNFEDN